MKRLLRLFFFFFLFLPAALPAAEEAAPGGFTFRVRRAQATVRMVTDGKPFAQRLVISFSDSRIPAQVIPCGDGSAHSIELEAAGVDPQFESADYDGDSYHDFSFLDSTGTSVNHIRHYFFYSPGKRQFVRRRDFDQSGVAHYDVRTRVFSSYWRGGPTAGSAFYRFERGSLVQLRTVEKNSAEHFRDILPNAPEGETYIVTTVYLPGGRIRRFYSHDGP